MNEHQADRVEAIAKIVRNHGNGYDDPDRLRDLKRQTNPDAVHETVPGQGKG